MTHFSKAAVYQVILHFLITWQLLREKPFLCSLWQKFLGSKPKLVVFGLVTAGDLLKNYLPRISAHSFDTIRNLRISRLSNKKGEAFWWMPLSKIYIQLPWLSFFEKQNFGSFTSYDEITWMCSHRYQRPRRILCKKCRGSSDFSEKWKVFKKVKKRKKWN